MGRIEHLVHTMANKRLMDGQFDESSLTLKELHKIEQAIVKVVCAIYHNRIKYPSDQQEPGDEGVGGLKRGGVVGGIVNRGGVGRGWSVGAG